MRLEKRIGEANEINLSRIVLLCEEATAFIKLLEVIKHSSPGNSPLSDFLEQQKADIRHICKKYTDFYKECMFDKIQVRVETVEDVRESLALIRSKSFQRFQSEGHTLHLSSPSKGNNHPFDDLDYVI